MKKRWGIVLAAIILVVPGWVNAADVELPVPIQEYNNIRYYSLGVSVEERRTLPQLYPLKLIFATDQGHMLCDAEIVVSAGGKTVFKGRAENGPWLIIDLSPGAYDIEAVLEGKTRTAKGVVVTAGKKRTITLRWKTTEVGMGLKDKPEK